MAKEKGKTKKEKRWRAILLPFFLFHFSFFLAGCALLGVAAHKLGGAPAVEAKYVPAKAPMLVLVENYQRPSSIGGGLLARYLADELAANNVAPIVPMETLNQLRESQPDFARMSISAVGKATGAEQVLYVQMMQDQVTPLVGGETLQGQVSVRVKVVDVESGNTLWPTDLSDGHELGASTQLGAESGRSARDVQQHLYALIANQIAKLFYKWKPED